MGDLVFLACAVGSSIVTAIAIVQVPKHNAKVRPAFWVVLGLVTVGFWAGYALTVPW